MEKEYIVGIDFGHGETAAYVVPIATSDHMEEIGKALNIQVSGNDDEKVNPSVIYSKDEEYSLIDGNGKRLIAAFKNRISELNKDLEKKNAYKAFIRCIFESVKNNNDFLINNEDGCNFYFCIACPTRWNIVERQEYVSFFNEALAEYNVTVLFVMNESDAAYFTNKDTINSGELALVIDYGSSTIDYTLMLDDKKISEDGWSNQHLGANLIEKTLLLAYKDKNFQKYNLALSETITGLQASGNDFIIPNIDDRLEYGLRKSKEAAYRTRDSAVYLAYNFYRCTNCEQLLNVNFNIIFPNAEDEILNYKLAVNNDFKELSQKIQNKISLPVSKIILSGGASNMHWVKKCAKENFPDAAIIEDHHPSYVVAKGIAKYAKAQLDALNRVLSILNNVDYKDVYEHSDALATRDAIKRLFPNILKEVKGNKNMTANEIFVLVANFILHLDSGNETYCEMFRENLNATIRKRIGEEIKKAINETFNINVDVSDIDFSIDVQVMNYQPAFFEEGPGGKKIIDILVSATGPHVFTSFDPNKQRNISERSTIAQQLESGLTVLNPFGKIQYEEDALNNIIAVIKEYTLTYAKEIFHKKELFKTTYVQ